MRYFTAISDWSDTPLSLECDTIQEVKDFLDEEAQADYEHNGMYIEYDYTILLVNNAGEEDEAIVEIIESYTAIGGE